VVLTQVLPSVACAKYRSPFLKPEGTQQKSSEDTSPEIEVKKPQNSFGEGAAVAQLVEALHYKPEGVRFPMVSLEFFIGIILSAALWPWGRLTEMSTRNISWGVNAANAYS
jgi:hypothetical protein